MTATSTQVTLQVLQLAGLGGGITSGGVTLTTDSELTDMTAAVSGSRY